jgi:SAM-dependent methyltransferase
MAEVNFTSWSLVPAAEMSTFLAAVEKQGWKKAILESTNPQIKSLYLFTDCPSRADGTFYLSLNSTSRVLDLGAGWGSYTFALSPRVSRVVAADSDQNSLAFIAARAKQDGRQNVETVLIEPLERARLPFADGAFDGVILNGVLEWVGSQSTTGDPLKLQVNCLKEIKRILAPGGELWIGIENRFGLSYLTGAPDDHLRYYSSQQLLGSQGIAFTTIVPRFVADWITRKKLGRPYRTYTHSLAGYKRLLARAGFRATEFYFPEQGYRAASTKIYPLDCQELKTWMRKKIKHPFWQQLVSFLGLEPKLCDSYFILARRK